MKIKFKKCGYAAHFPLPTRGTEESAGIDLRLASIQECNHGLYKIGYGVHIEIPFGYRGDLYIRSSTGKQGLAFTNKVGLIDSDYRGELISYVTFNYRGHDFPGIGDRIAQIVVSKYLKGTILEVDELSTTVRGEGGYGSTGNG